MSCTTAELIQVELRAASEFTESTIPSLSTITTWIGQTCDYISSLAGKDYSVSEKGDYFNYKNETELYLKYTPLVTVVSVEYDDSDLTEVANWNTLTELSQFKTDVDKAVIVLYPSEFLQTLKVGLNRFRVTYNAGYATVPPSVQMLATKMVANRALETLINQNIDTRADGGSISVGDIRIVEPANYGVGSYKQLKSDIATLTDSVVGGSKGFRVYRYG